MARKARDFLALLCGLAVVAGVVVYTVGGAAVQEETDASTAGPFRSGYHRRAEIAGFSGRAIVTLFVPEDRPEALESLRPLVAAEPVVAAMADYIGAIVTVPPLRTLSREEFEVLQAEKAAALGAAKANNVALAEEIALPRFPYPRLPAVVIERLDGCGLGVLEGEQLTAAALAEALSEAKARARSEPSELLRLCKEDVSVLGRLLDEGATKAVRLALDALSELEPGSALQESAETYRSRLPSES